MHHLILWEMMAPVYCKCVTRVGRSAILLDRMSLGGVQYFRCNFFKPKNFDSWPKRFRFQPKFFYICKFVQKNEFFNRLGLGLQGLQVKSIKQVWNRAELLYIRLVMQRERNILDQQINTSEVFLYFYSSYVHLFVSLYGKRGVGM